MKTPEELKMIKEEIETMGKKLAELSEDELKEVVGGNKEFTILPRDESEFWYTWNPAFPFIYPDKGLD